MVSTPWRREERDRKHWGGEEPWPLAVVVKVEEEEEEDGSEDASTLLLEDGGGTGTEKEEEAVPGSDYPVGRRVNCEDPKKKVKQPETREEEKEPSTFSSVCCCPISLLVRPGRRDGRTREATRWMLASSAAAMSGGVGAEESEEVRLRRALLKLRSLRLRAILFERPITLPPPARNAVRRREKRTRKKAVFFAGDASDDRPPFRVPVAFAQILMTGNIHEGAEGGDGERRKGVRFGTKGKSNGWSSTNHSTVVNTSENVSSSSSRNIVTSTTNLDVVRRLSV